MNRAQILGGLTPTGIGPGALVLFHPLLRGRLTTPLLRTSDDDVSYPCDVLSAAPPDATAATPHPSARRHPLTPADRRAHLGRPGRGRRRAADAGVGRRASAAGVGPRASDLGRRTSGVGRRTSDLGPRASGLAEVRLRPVGDPRPGQGLLG